MKNEQTTFLDLGLIPRLNTTVQTFFLGTDNPKSILVKVVGYNGKITELDSFLVLLDYHGVLIEKRLDRIYPIPLSKDYLIQFGWEESGDIEKGDAVSYINRELESLVSFRSLKVMYSTRGRKKGEKGVWLLSIREVLSPSVNYYRIRFMHDLSNIYEFLKGISVDYNIFGN